MSHWLAGGKKCALQWMLDEISTFSSQDNSLILLAIENANTSGLENCAQPKEAALPKVISFQTTCIQYLVKARPPFYKGSLSSRALLGLAEAIVATPLTFISSLLQILLSLLLYS